MLTVITEDGTELGHYSNVIIKHTCVGDTVIVENKYYTVIDRSIDLDTAKCKLIVKGKGVRL